jgi:hypothetical protein
VDINRKVDGIVFKKSVVKSVTDSLIKFMKSTSLLHVIYLYIYLFIYS